jgi:hypothetical protein
MILGWLQPLGIEEYLLDVGGSMVSFKMHACQDSLQSVKIRLPCRLDDPVALSNAALQDGF